MRFALSRTRSCVKKCLRRAAREIRITVALLSERALIGMDRGTTVEYQDLDQSDWARCLPLFKNILRPSFVADPVAEMGDFETCAAAITQARAENVSFGVLGDKLVNLVFEGYRDWYQYEDVWILRELAEVLDIAGEQQSGLLVGLKAIGGAADEDSRKTAIQEFLPTVEQYVNVWQQEAEREGYTRAEAVDQRVELEGATNETNWQANRIPGTYYWVFVDGRYLYSDLPKAPISEWETLQVREQLAADGAKKWGDGFCTPTGGNPDYGGDYVFALDRYGPWLTQSAAEAALAKPPVLQSAAAEAGSPEQILVARWTADRAAKLDELFAELKARGWDPDAAEIDDTMPTRDEIIERFDRQVGGGIISKP